MAVKFEKLVKDTADTMKKAGKRKTSEYNAVGVVKRVDGKTAWVHFSGGVDETPVKMTIGANVGDKVRVHIGGGKAYIIGNETSPPTDDRQANKAIQYTKEVEKTADTATEKIEDIEYLVGDGENSGITISTQYYLSSSNTELIDGEWTDVLPVYQAGYYYWIKTVTVYADGSEIESEPMLDINNQITAEVNAVVTAENQHFWHDSSGAYVTNAEGSYSSGYAMKITTYGLLQTYNGNNLMSLTSSGLSFYQSDGSTPLATYSSGGVYLYAGGTVAASFTSSSTTVGNDASGSTTTAASLTSSGFNIRMYNSQSNTRFTAFSIGLDGIIPEVTGVSYAPLRFNCGIYVKGITGIQSQYDIKAYGSGDAIVADSGFIKNLWAVTNASSYTNNVHIGSAGRFFMVSGSSKRWKNSIEDVRDEALDPHHLYDIEVKQFKFNIDYVKNEKDQRYDVPVVGFIAEQMQECYPIAVDVDEETGDAMDWNMKFIIPPMLALIQEQKKEIDLLSERVKILEERSVA